MIETALPSLKKLTKKQLIEKVYDQQQESYALLDGLPQAIVVVDTQQYVQHVNTAGQQWLDPDNLDLPLALEELFPALKETDLWQEVCDGKRETTQLHTPNGQHRVELQSSWHSHYQVFLLQFSPTGERSSNKSSAFVSNPVDSEETSLLSNYTQEGYFIVDDEGEYQYISPSVERLTGHSPEELQKLTIYQLLHPDDLTVYEETVSRIRSSGKEERDVMYRVLKNDGCVSWHKADVIPIKNEEEEVTALLWLMRDISQEHSLIDTYRTVDERLSFIAENANDGFWDWNLQNGEVYRNQRYNDLFGISSDFKVTYESWMSGIHPDDAIRVQQEMERFFESGEKNYITEYRYQKSPEECRWCRASCSLVRDVQGNPWRLIGTIGDIHDLKEAEQILLQQAEMLRKVQSAAKIGQWKYNIHKKELVGSEEFYRIYEIDPDSEQSVYEQSRDRVVAGNLSEAWEIIDHALRNRVSYHFDYLIVNPSGARRWVHLTGNVFIPDEQGEIAEIVGLVQDITDRKEAELGLKENEAKYRLLADNISDVLLLFDMDFGVQYVSPSVEQMTGYTPEEFVELREQDEDIHPDDLSEIKQLVRNYEQGLVTEGQVKLRIRSKHGGYIWVESRARMILNEQGERRLLVTSRDITQERQAELALRESEASYRLLAENASDLIVLFNLSWNVLYVSPSVEHITGFDPDEWLADRAFKDVHPDDLPELQKRMKLYPEERSQGQSKFRIKHKNGYYVWLDSKISLIRDDQGEQRLLVVSRDVTQEMWAQQELESNRQYFQSIFDNTTDALFLIDVMSQRITDCNAAAITMFEALDKKELVGQQKASLRQHPRTPEESSQILTAFERGRVWKEEAEYVTARGNTLWGSLAIIYFDEDTQLVRITDITERKQAEEKLRDSEAKYRLLAENAIDIIALCTFDGRWKYMSPATLNVLGYPPDEYMQIFGTSNNVHPDDVPSLDDAIEELKLGEYNVRRMIRSKHRNGSWVWLDCISNFVIDNDGEHCILVVGRDITEHQAMEQALQESEARYRLLAENSSDVISLMNPEGTKVYTSPSIQTALGYTPEEYLVKRQSLKVIHPKDRPLIKRAVRQLQKGVSEQTIEVRTQHKKGHYVWAESRYKLIKDDQGQPQIMVVARDITQKREAELALQESEAKYRLLAENSSDIIVLLTLKWKLVYVSPSIETITGYTPKEWQKLRQNNEYLHPDDVSKIEQMKGEYEGTRTEGQEKVRIARKDGSYAWVDAKAHVIRDQDAEAMLMVVYRDVSEEVKAQQELAASQQYFQSIFNSTADALFLVDEKDHVIQDCNEAAAVLLETTDRYELIGQKKANLRRYPRTEQENARVLKALKKHGIWKEEAEYVTAKGHRLWGNLAIMHFNEHTQLIRITDITERKQAEERLRESEAKYRFLGENSSDVIMLFDLDWVAHYISPSIQPLTGFTADEWRSLCQSGKHVHPEDMALVRQVREEHRDTRAEAREKVRVICKDGTYAWVDVKTNRILDEHGHHKVMVVYRDISEEVKAQQELSASQQYFQSIFNSTADALFLVDKESHVIKDCNAAAVEMLGTGTKENLIGRQGREFHRQKVSDEEAGAAIEEFRRDEKWRGEIEYVSEDGREFWGNLIASPFNEDCLIVRVSDITLLKEKEQEIVRAEALYRQVVETQQEMICRFLPDTTLTFVNQAYCRFVGKTEDELLGTSFLQYIPDIERSPVLAHLKEVKKKRSAIEYERLSIRNERSLWLYWKDYPVFDQNGVLKEFQSVGVDITLRKQAEEKLRKSEKQLKEAQKLARLGNFEYNLVSRKGRCFPDFAELIGSEDRSLYKLPVGEQFLQSIHPEDFPVVVKTFQEYIEDGQPRTYDVRLKWSEVEDHHLTITYGKLYRDETGKPVRVSGTVQDITERKQVEQELRQAKKSLERANDQKDWILSILSHEVRNSLNAIAGFANLLNHTYAITHREEITETLAFSSRHLLALISNIHDFSKIELGKFESQPVEFDLHDLFEKAAILFRSQLRHHISLNLKIDQHTPRFVRGDATRLHQVLNNLVGNAIKFTERGAINITLSRGQSNRQSTIGFTVEDTGIGIPKERIDNVFKPGYKTEEDTFSENTTNTGLGLYVVRQLVKHLGGSIQLDSEVGVGTSMRVEFPIEELLVSEEPAHSETTVVGRDASHLKIMYIEDDYFNRMLMSAYVQLGNLTLDFAKDDQEALGLLEQNTYDVILTDIVLSGIDGSQLAQQIQERYRDLAPPIVAVTAYSAEEIRKQGKSKPFATIITKPIDPNQLYEVIFQLGTQEKPYREEQPAMEVISAASDAPTLKELLEKMPEQRNKIIPLVQEEVNRHYKTLCQVVSQQNYLTFHKTLHTLLPLLYLIEANDFAVFLRSLDDLPSEKKEKDKLYQKMKSFMDAIA